MSRSNSPRRADGGAEHTRIFFTMVQEGRTAPEEPRKAVVDPPFRPAEVLRQTLSGPLTASAIRPSPMIPVGTAPEGTSSGANPNPEPAPAGDPVTQYFPVELLLSRRQAADTPSPPVASSPAPTPVANTAITDPDLTISGLRPSLLARARTLWQRLSTVNRISVGLVPLLAAVLIAGRFVRPSRASVRRPTAPIASQPVSMAKPQTASSNAEAAPLVASANGTATRSGLSRKAADAVAEGRYDVALDLYRKLAEQEPNVTVYREAVRILERRTAREATR